MKQIAPVAVLVAASLISGCSNTDSPLTRTIDYHSSGKKVTNTLEVPPDLTKPVIQNQYAIPVHSSQSQAGGGVPLASSSEGPVALNQLGDIQLEREGNQRWLLVKDKTPDQLWQPLKRFWEDSGFTIKQDDPALGIMETDWAENRAKLPQDGVRKLLETVGLGGIYSTGERDKFRIRLEKTARGTEIYFSHRGMEEVYTDNQKSNTIWQPRPTDPGLEAAFLGRFMLKMGASEKEAEAQIKKTTEKVQTPSVPEIDGKLVLNDSFDRAWRRVGLALDRVGLLVTDRNRSQGLYYVKVAKGELDKQESKGGFWSSLAFWRSDEEKTLQVASAKDHDYQVQLVGQDNGTTTLAIDDAQGKPTSDDFVKQALRKLQTELQ